MKKHLFIFLISTLTVFALSGCLKDEAEPLPCTYDACATKAPQSEIDAVQHYLDSAGITATQHCSGLFYAIADSGTGKTPGACQTVGVRYKGMLANGQVFDSSSNDGISLNLGGVIKGWRNGVPLLKEGGKITLYIPPSLGYGNEAQYDRRNPTQVLIPANSILVFEVGLILVD